ncbi:transporter substrate-binding domain-containing protein [Micromonospora fulviviridis]|uniref:Transporter substrate-binding domain-containing protein n=1 Tax=Micromonospora fulviviridis TaxID=47860 RepID=A0ABV2VWP3_9ACTN
MCATSYFDATQLLVVAPGSTAKSLSDLVGKRVGVQGNTTGDDYVTGQVSKQSLQVEVVDFPDLGSLQQALATGQVAAAVGDLPVWNDYVKKNPGQADAVTEFNTGEQYGFAVKKGGDPRLLQTVNDTLAQAKADGIYDKLYLQWIGPRPKQ